MKLTSNHEPISINMRTAIGLQKIFVITIILAFIATLTTGTAEMRLISVALITPFIILSLAFIYYCRKRKVWGYAGASILGAVGVVLRVIVST